MPAGNTAPRVTFSRHGETRRVTGTGIYVVGPYDSGYRLGGASRASIEWLAANDLRGVTFSTLREVRRTLTAVFAVSAPAPHPTARQLLRRDPATGTYMSRCGRHTVRRIEVDAVKLWELHTEGTSPSRHRTLESAASLICARDLHDRPLPG